MRFPTAVGVLVACGLAVAAPVPKAKEKPKPDTEAIQGVWQLDKFDLGQAGQVPPPGIESIRFTFKDRKLTVSRNGQTDAKQGEYKLDPTSKPKSIDLIEPGGGRNTLGIYELDGDTLKICLAERQNAVRPTEFKPDGMRFSVVTFKRVAEAKKGK